MGMLRPIRLGWRLVGSLHTRGKPYRLTRANIATFLPPGPLCTRLQPNLRRNSKLEATEARRLPSVLPLPRQPADPGAVPPRC